MTRPCIGSRAAVQSPSARLGVAAEHPSASGTAAPTLSLAAAPLRGCDVAKPVIQWRPGPLVRALLGRFDGPLADLPDGLRSWVELAFAASDHWDALTPNQRRKRALWWDADENDREIEFVRSFEIAVGEGEADPPDINGREKKKANLARLRDERAQAQARMDARRRAPTTAPQQSVAPAKDDAPADAGESTAPPRRTTPDQMYQWMLKLQRDLKAAGNRHGRDIILSKARKRFGVRNKIVLGIWNARGSDHKAGEVTSTTNKKSL
jgi:hypothetical protein